VARGRILAFLLERETMLGLDPDLITAANWAELRASDLFALLDRLARVEALADEWDGVEVRDEWDAADRWGNAATDLRAALTEETP
jgi:hypothetical protein